MKKTLMLTAAIFLIAAMLAGCNLFGPEIHVPEIPSYYATATEMPRGTSEGGVYTNETLYLTFTAPEGWTYYTDEEIANLAGAGASSGYVCDMYAAGPEDSCVAVECLDLEANGGTDMNEEKFLDSYKKENQKAGSFEFSAYYVIEIGGNTFKAVTITSPNENLIKYYYVRRSGIYMISITVILPKDGDLSSVLANFT